MRVRSFSFRIFIGKSHPLIDIQYILSSVILQLNPHIDQKFLMSLPTLRLLYAAPALT